MTFKNLILIVLKKVVGWIAAIMSCFSPVGPRKSCHVLVLLVPA